MEVIKGGVTSPKGFSAAGVHAGLKKAKKDMALLVSAVPAASAAAFTTNKVKAAPVLWDMDILKGGKAQAVVINSGNANACTGEKGLEDAEETAAYAAGKLGLEKDMVYVSSTGVIGVPLDMAAIRHGIDMLVPALSADGSDAAEAILTTDTFVKEAAATAVIGGVKVGDDTSQHGHDAFLHNDRRCYLPAASSEASRHDCRGYLQYDIRRWRHVDQ